jgi:hypothetical protein
MGRAARAAACLLVGALAVSASLGGYFFYLVGGTLSQRPPALPQSLLEVTTVDPDVDMPGLWPGIRLPPARAVADAALRDDDEVIGVCAGGRARAYLVRVMGWPQTRHVVNDQLGGCAVSVTYCDRTGCSRVFTGGRAAAPLELDVGGWINKGMALHTGDADYSQETGECLSHPSGPRIPYAQLPHERTTWGAWREAHPETDVYVGDSPQG